MNVVFHVMTAIAVTAGASKERNSKPRRSVQICGLGFISCLLLNGCLDILPHGYPFKAGTDMLIGALLFPITLAFLYRDDWLLFASCYVGCTIPDVIDLGPTMLAKWFNIEYSPAGKIFFWHQPEYSGSIFDGSRPAESLLYHSLVVTLCGIVIFANRSKFRGLKAGFA